VKTRYVVLSIIVALLIIMAGSTASAQLFNTSAMGLSSFNIPSGIMNTSSYGLPSFATNPSISPVTSYSTFIQNINKKYHPDAIGIDTTPVNTGSNTTSSWQMPSMPVMDFSSFGSNTTLSDLLSSPVTQTVGGSTPNATHNYTMDSNNKTIDMNINDTIYVQLPASIDTGSIWNLTTTSGLNVTNQRMFPPKIGASSGSSGIQLSAVQEWSIQAVKPGVQKITAKCAGPGNQTYTLTVNVKG
jgi:predicted secreted protein